LAENYFLIRQVDGKKNIFSTSGLLCPTMDYSHMSYVLVIIVIIVNLYQTNIIYSL
jgi:hypothetical protein